MIKGISFPIIEPEDLHIAPLLSILNIQPVRALPF